MDIRNPDLRMKKTEYLLINAMANLLRTNLFSRITVNDLCIEAMVSRSAFYKHFEDKYALLRCFLNMANNELKKNLEGKPLSDFIHTMLEYIKANVSIFKNIISSGLSGEIMEIILSPHLTNIKNAMINYYDDTPIPVEVAAYYHASAVVNTILVWVERNMHYSVEEMTSYLIAMLPPSLRDINLPFNPDEQNPGADTSNS